MKKFASNGHGVGKIMTKRILGDQGAASWATSFSRAKVYNKNGRALGHLLLLNEFQKCLKSRLLIPASGISNASKTHSVRVNAQGLSCSCCKLSPVKIPSPQLATPGSSRMDKKLPIE